MFTCMQVMRAAGIFVAFRRYHEREIFVCVYMRASSASFCLSGVQAAASRLLKSPSSATDLQGFDRQ